MNTQSFSPRKMWDVLRQARKGMNNIGKPSTIHPGRWIGDVFTAEYGTFTHSSDGPRFCVFIEGDGTSEGDTTCVGCFFTETQADLFAGLLSLVEDDDEI